MSGAATPQSLTASAYNMNGMLRIAGNKQVGFAGTLRWWMDNVYMGVLREKAPDGYYDYGVSIVPKNGMHTAQVTADATLLTATSVFTWPTTTSPTTTSSPTLDVNFILDQSPLA